MQRSRRRLRPRALGGARLPILHHLLNIHSQPVLTCRWHPHQPVLATGGMDGAVRFSQPLY